MNSSNTIKIAVGLGTALAVSVFVAKVLTKSRNRKKITRFIDTIEEFRKHTVQIKDKEKVEDKVCQLIKGGADKLQIIMDFDHTITRYHYKGKSCASTHAILEQGPNITEEYKSKAQWLFEKYYPIEMDPEMPKEEKIPHMLQWYSESHNNLVNSRISKNEFSKMVEMSNAMLRDGCQSLFETLNEHKIPLLIFSAGVGDMVQEVLKYFNCIYPNMKFVSNFMDFDKDGKLTGFKGDLIHMFNKNETALQNSDYFNHLKAKTNILLVGDNLGDLDMSHGIAEIDTILKIGFLNTKVEESLPKYMHEFDIVLIDDQSMDVINGLLRRIL